MCAPQPAPTVRYLLRFTSRSTQRFVAAFPLMKEAYVTGAMAFGLLVAAKPPLAG